jgi:hypothetical protein
MLTWSQMSSSQHEKDPGSACSRIEALWGRHSESYVPGNCIPSFQRRNGLRVQRSQVCSTKPPTAKRARQVYQNQDGDPHRECDRSPSAHIEIGGSDDEMVAEVPEVPHHSHSSSSTRSCMLYQTKRTQTKILCRHQNLGSTKVSSLSFETKQYCGRYNVMNQPFRADDVGRYSNHIYTEKCMSSCVYFLPNSSVLKNITFGNRTRTRTILLPTYTRDQDLLLIYRL